MFVVSRMALIPVVAPHYNNKITTTETGQFHDYFSLRIAADRFGSDLVISKSYGSVGSGPRKSKTVLFGSLPTEACRTGSNRRKTLTCGSFAVI